MILDDMDEPLELELEPGDEAYADEVDVEELLDDDLALEEEDASDYDDLLSDPYLQELAKILEDQQHNLDNAGALE